MPVRYEDDTTRPKPVSAGRAPSREQGGQAPRERHLGRWVMVGVIVVLLIATVVGALSIRNQDQPAPTTEATGAPVTLPVGEAAQNLGATEVVAGVPAGFPQSTEGAVSAMMTYGNAAGAALFRTPQERAEIAERIFTEKGRTASGLTDEVAAETQELLGVNEAGIAVRQDGSLDPARTAFAECAYEFGAYRVDSVTTFQVASPEPDEPTTLPTEVVVTTWSPCLSGVGGAQDVTDIEIRWTQQTSIMRWKGGDWRVDSTVYPDELAPAPSDLNDVGVSFAERARLLGEGWTLPADATEEVTPAFWAGGTR